MIDTVVSRWLFRWRHKKAASSLPLGLTEHDIQGLRQLIASSSWKHYVRALDALGEQQAAEFASGLPHDKYLFTAGALTALRRVYTLADDLIAATTRAEELSNARDRVTEQRTARYAAGFVNTPWYDSWRANDT